MSRLLEQVAPVEPGAADEAITRELFGLTRQAPAGCVRAMGSGDDSNAAMRAAERNLDRTRLSGDFMTAVATREDGSDAMAETSDGMVHLVVQACS